MKSIFRISSSVRGVCPVPSACFSVNRAPVVSRLADSASRTVIEHQPCGTAVRSFHGTKVKTAAVQHVSPSRPAHLMPVPGRAELDRTVHRYGRPAAPLSPYSPYGKPQGRAPITIQALFKGEVIPELCARLAHLPSTDRAEGLATLLGACVEFGLDPQNPVALRLTDECLELLSCRDIRVAQLCHLGEVVYALEGPKSALLVEVLDSIGGAVEEDLSPTEAVRIYSLMALCSDPTNPQQTLMLSSLHRLTQRLVHRFKAQQVSQILQVLLKLQPRQAITLVLRLSHRASRVFKAFSDDEVIKVLSALMILGQHDEELLSSMEKHLPGRLADCDPELIGTVMEYCLHFRCRSEPIFEAVAENFVRHSESHTTPQIAKQVVAMGRLNYLPQCSSQMFKKLESILSARFSQFQPRSLIEVMHACMHLERFPLNYLSRVFSPHFLQRLQVGGEPLDRTALVQLTQLHLSGSLECRHYWGPRLPYFTHVKKFSSVDQAFETPMESLLYRRVKGPLVELLGGEFYSTRILTHTGYTIDVEICLDEKGYVLPLSQWEQTSKRLVLCLDGQSRFCSNTRHMLGKEATKRRHLRRMGYELVQIPYYEFEKLGTLEEQVQYLYNKIFPTIFKFTHRPRSSNGLGSGSAGDSL